MTNQFLVLIDNFVGIFLLPVGLLIKFLSKSLRFFYSNKSKKFLVIKLLGAGNFLSMQAFYNSTNVDIVTVKSNVLTIKKFNIGSKIYVINDKNLILLVFTSIKVFFQLSCNKYNQVINLELESKFAKFLSLIVPSNILSGISSHNKSFLDPIVYDRYLVSPILLNRNDIISQLISFKPKTNIYFNLLIKEHQNNFKRNFFPFKSIDHVTVFPTCSSTDNLRRVDLSNWLLILKKLSNNKKISKITLIFQNKKDIQFAAFEKLIGQIDSGKICLKITDFKEFVDAVRLSDLIVSVDSQAIHVAQFYKKRAIVIYGPTSPFGIDLHDTSYPITQSLSCSPCTHKYNKLPCENKAPCMNFTAKEFDIFD
jgi:ADP-heptose:LPS heptosyltransferase